MGKYDYQDKIQHSKLNLPKKFPNMHILTNNFTQVSEDSGFRLHVYRKFIFTWSKGVFCKSHTAVFCWGGDFPVLLKFWLVDLVSVEHSMIYLYFDLDSVSLRWSGHTITTPLMLAWCFIALHLTGRSRSWSANLWSINGWRQISHLLVYSNTLQNPKRDLK